MIVGKPCACGITVYADPEAPASGVQLHNASPEHRAWRRNGDKVRATVERRARMRADLEVARLTRWAVRAGVPLAPELVA